MRIKQLSFILSFLCWISAVNAQIDSRIAFAPASFNDFLPSQYVYQSMVDKQGILWLLTEEGICNYNGNRLKVFNSSDGLPNSIFYKIKQDAKGTIWVYSFNHEIYYFQNGVFHSNEFELKLKGSQHWILSNWFIDSNNHIYLSYHNFRHIRYSSGGELIELTPSTPHDSCLRIIQQHAGYHLLYLSPNSVRSSGHLRLDCVFLEANSQRKSKTSEAIRNELFNYRHYSLLDSNKILVAIDNYLFDFTRDEFSYYQFDTKVLDALFLDREGNLLVGTENNGCFVFKNGDITRNPIHLAQGLSISDIAQDEEGNYWMSTFYNGVIYIPDLHKYELYHGEQNFSNITQLDIDQNKWFLLHYNGDLSIIGENVEIVRQHVFGKLNKFYSFVVRDNRVFVSQYRKMEWRDLRHPLNSKMLVSRYVSDIVKKDEVYFLCPVRNNAIYRVDDEGGMHTVFQGGKENIRARSFQLDNKGRIYLGGKDKLAIYKNNHPAEPVLLKQYDLNVKSMVDFEEYGVLVASRDSGLFIADDGRFKRIKMDSKIDISSISSVKKVDDQVMICTKNKILLTTVTEMNKSILSTKPLFPKLFKVQGEVMDLDLDKDVLLVTTKKGVFHFDVKKAKEYSPYKSISFDNFNVNSINTTLIEPLELSYDQNNIEVSYRLKSLLPENQIKYEYKFEGIDQKWRSTYTTKLVFPNLPSGEYLLKIRLSHDSYFRSNELKASFTISPPMWETWWFISLVAVSLISFTTLLVRRKLARDQMILQSQINIWTSKYQTLSAQLSPHFIFNTLQSINSIIYKYPADKVNAFVGKFSRLMRMVLNNSRHEQIWLKDEIHVIQNYLELEQERLKNSFDFSIFMDETVKANEERIPPLYIQPFLENAIQHGLPQDAKGKIDIRFMCEDQFLICEIRDNGKGIEEQSLNYPMDKVHSVQINNERTSLLQKIHNSSFSIDIVKRKSVQDNDSGTLVRIIFPRKGFN